MSISQQVLDEMLLFERQCMGFFDDSEGPEQEDLTSSVLSKKIE